MGWSLVVAEQARRADKQRLTLGPGKGGELCLESSEQGEKEGRREWKNGGGSLLSGAAHGHPTAGLGGGRAGGGRRAGLGGVRKCGRRDSKSAWLAEPKNRLVGDVVGRLAGLFFAASTARKNRKKEEKECLAPGLAFLLSGPATKRVKLSGGCLVSACLEGPQHRCRRDGCPTKFRDQVPKLAAHSLHRHLSTATRPVVLRKMRECGSWVPGCVRRTCSGSNGSKRGVNPPKAQQVLELLISGDSESGEDLGPVKSPRQRESAAGQGMALMS